MDNTRCYRPDVSFWELASLLERRLGDAEEALTIAINNFKACPRGNKSELYTAITRYQDAEEARSHHAGSARA